jgi:tRNA A-37 threonylcarbamoyl transferase component Bud32
MILRIAFFTLLTFSPSLANVHPVHISVTEINYSEKDKSLQITSRMFVDDTELAVRAWKKNPDLDILEPKGATTRQLVEEYVRLHLKVWIDGKMTKMNFLAVEKEDLSFICYIEISNVKKAKSIKVLNDCIMEMHDDQSNLVHITYKAPVKSVRLTRQNPDEVFNFEKK